MKTLSIALLCAALVGCSSTPIDFGQAATPPEQRIFARQLLTDLPAPPPGRAMLLAARDSLQYRGACSFDLFVDDVAIARLFPSDGVKVLMEPGVKRFRLESGGLLCDIYSTAIVHQVAPGDTVRLQLGLAEGRPMLAVLNAPGK